MMMRPRTKRELPELEMKQQLERVKEARETEATEQGVEAPMKKSLLVALFRVSLIRDLEPLRLVLQKAGGRSLSQFPLPQQSWPQMTIQDLK